MKSILTFVHGPSRMGSDMYNPALVATPFDTWHTLQHRTNLSTHNLFHSRCMIEGKVCQLVIDSDSCENVVAEEVINKLALEMEQHPNPYRLEWLKKGTKIVVSKRYLVYFSIGVRYKDKMWCDVVAMDACHLLLGRPWQCDRSAHNDGRKNTYSFMIGTVKITLLTSLGTALSLPRMRVTPNLYWQNGSLSWRCYHQKWCTYY
jgi:hypothetical protein